MQIRLLCKGLMQEGGLDQCHLTTSKWTEIYDMQDFELFRWTLLWFFWCVIWTLGFLCRSLTEAVWEHSLADDVWSLVKICSHTCYEHQKICKGRNWTLFALHPLCLWKQFIGVITPKFWKCSCSLSALEGERQTWIYFRLSTLLNINSSDCGHTHQQSLNSVRGGGLLSYTHTPPWGLRQLPVFLIEFLFARNNKPKACWALCLSLCLTGYQRWISQSL